MDNLWSASRRTSNAAYESIKPHKSSMKYRILKFLEERESTDDEMEMALGMSHQTLSSCRRALVKDGLVEATGDKRPTRSGRLAQVWTIV